MSRWQAAETRPRSEWKPRNPDDGSMETDRIFIETGPALKALLRKSSKCDYPDQAGGKTYSEILSVLVVWSPLLHNQSKKLTYYADFE